MQVIQTAEFANDAVKESIGEENLLKEDLSNVTDFGNSIENVMGVENFYKKISDKIGRTVIAAREYDPLIPSILREGWEWGSIMEKISYGLAKFSDNPAWELEDGISVDPFVVTMQPDVNVNFWNKLRSMEIDYTRPDMQMKSAFKNPDTYRAFIAGLDTQITNSMRVGVDEMCMRTINNMIAETMYDLDSTGNYSGKTGVRAVNLLYIYNQSLPAGATSLTPAEFRHNPDAIRYAINLFKNVIPRLRKMNVNYNLGSQPRHTPTDRLSIVMLSEFKNAAETFLQSDTFHKELVSLPNNSFTDLVCWQGTGDDYAFDKISKIKVTTSEGHDVEAGGILAVMFDRDALGVMNENFRVRTQRNEKGEYTNFFSKWDCNFFNDKNEQFVVFYAA